MDWFEALTGFRERGWAETRGLLEVDGSTLRSKVNGREYHIGDGEMPSLAELRARVAGPRVPKGSLKVSNITGDVRLLHSAPEFNGFFSSPPSSTCSKWLVRT